MKFYAVLTFICGSNRFLASSHRRSETIFSDWATECHGGRYVSRTADDVALWDRGGGTTGNDRTGIEIDAKGAMRVSWLTPLCGCGCYNDVPDNAELKLQLLNHRRRPSPMWQYGIVSIATPLCLSRLRHGCGHGCARHTAIAVR